MRKKLNILKTIVIVICTFLAISFFITGLSAAKSEVKEYTFLQTLEFVRVTEALEEDYSDETVCPVEYQNGDYILIVNYTYDEWEELPSGHTAKGYVYLSDDGDYLTFGKEADDKMISDAAYEKGLTTKSRLFGFSLALILCALGFFVITVWDKHFTAYEQIWFAAILIAASVVSVLFPEEDINGINGIVIMGLYLADTFLNILCELLISKQSKWNFIVSVFVEICEILICVVLMYRFATLASTLFFWLPCDIISFINWHKHPDRDDSELTAVRTLKGWQEVAIIAAIVVWTAGVGYFLTTLDLGTTLFDGNRTLEVITCYIDACASAVGIANGVFILLRLREQWIAWYITAILEGVINIISGQFVLLVLKLGYITNTTYGYIKWTKYINKQERKLSSKA